MLKEIAKKHPLKTAGAVVTLIGTLLGEEK